MSNVTNANVRRLLESRQKQVNQWISGRRSNIEVWQGQIDKARQEIVEWRVELGDINILLEEPDPEPEPEHEIVITVSANVPFTIERDDEA